MLRRIGKRTGVYGNKLRQLTTAIIKKFVIRKYEMLSGILVTVSV